MDPEPLSGEAYLTGSLRAPSITLVFGPPFSLTLSGAVALATNSTTFPGLPDIPLSDLRVFVRRRQRKRLQVVGVSLRSAKLKSVTLSVSSCATPPARASACGLRFESWASRVTRS